MKQWHIDLSYSLKSFLRKAINIYNREAFTKRINFLSFSTHILIQCLWNCGSSLLSLTEYLSWNEFSLKLLKWPFWNSCQCFSFIDIDPMFFVELDISKNFLECGRIFEIECSLPSQKLIFNLLSVLCRTDRRPDGDT